MKEEFRLGDRIRMIECKDPYSPIMPGDKGVIKWIDSMGTLFPSWNSGRTLGVCLDEDTVEKIPLEQEFRNFDSASVMDCDEEDAFDAHAERASATLSKMEMAAADSDGAWVVRRTYLDHGHKSREPVYAFTEPDGLHDLIEGADLKNGIDTGYLKTGRSISFTVIAYGQRYTSPQGCGMVTEAFECKLVGKEAAADYRERMDAGWERQGEGPQKLFFSHGDHQPLAQHVAECQKLFPEHAKGKSHEMER